MSNVFSPNERRIYACGQLETNNPPIALVVIWWYEGEVIFWETVYDVEEYFYSSIRPTRETFSEGTYKIEVFVGKSLMQEVEFQVEQP